MMMKLRHGAAAGVALVCLNVAGPAAADSVYSVPFGEVPDESGATVTTGLAEQMSMDYWENTGDNAVHFRFHNNGPIDSIITRIFFDDPLELLSNSGFEDGPANTSVKFDDGSTGNGNFGGLGNLDPSFSDPTVFTANSPCCGDDNGTGIKPEKWAEFSFELGDTSFSDVRNALLEDLRVAIHVQSIDGDHHVEDGGSAMFVVTPLPAGGWAGLAMLAALGTVAAVRRRLRANPATIA